MGLRPDHWIEEMVKNKRMIEPFETSQSKGQMISFGTSSYGYDFRLSNHYKIPDPTKIDVMDPKAIPKDAFQDHQGDHCVIAAGSFVLGTSLEYFRIPRDVLTLCSGKSTYARCGVLVNVTPFEPEWEGFVTVSIANLGPRPVRIHSGEGIAQLVFFVADQQCRTSYADRKGKYQAQKGIGLSQVGGAQS